jgi:hypothetical protein
VAHVLDIAFVLLAAANVALLVGCARAIARARLEIRGQLPSSAGAAAPHGLRVGQSLPDDVLAELRSPEEPGLVVVLSDHCPACLHVVERFERTRPPRLDVAFVGDGDGLRARVERFAHVLPAAVSARLVDWGRIAGAPLLFTRDERGTIRWITTRWAELPEPAFITPVDNAVGAAPGGS